MLVHHANPSVNGFRWVSEDALLTVNNDGAAIWLIDAGKDIHEGGLPCAVLTEKAKDFPAFNLDGYVVVREHTRELLGDLPKL
jgi:hypothetical protein